MLHHRGTEALRKDKGRMLDAIGVLICRVFHVAMSWPGNYYRCLECGRKYRVPWARVTEPGVYEWR